MVVERPIRSGCRKHLLEMFRVRAEARAFRVVTIVEFGPVETGERIGHPHGILQRRGCSYKTRSATEAAHARRWPYINVHVFVARPLPHSQLGRERQRSTSRGVLLYERVFPDLRCGIGDHKGLVVGVRIYIPNAPVMSELANLLPVSSGPSAVETDMVRVRGSAGQYHPPHEREKVV